MPRSQGFARGDLDAAFPLDDKFLALRGRVSVERYYEATGIYFHVAAATWREAERKAVAKVCPDAGEIVADLIAVGLLDDDGCVTKRAFTHSVGRARRQRKVATERQARNRAEKSRAVTPLSRATTRDSVGTALTVLTDSVRTDGTGESEGVDALSTYWSLMGTYPSGRTKAWIEELANEFSDAKVSAVLASEAGGPRQGLLGRVRDRLRSDTDKTEKARAAAELARLAADAEKRRITPEQAAENRRLVQEELRKMVGPVVEARS